MNLGSYACRKQMAMKFYFQSHSNKMARLKKTSQNNILPYSLMLTSKGEDIGIFSISKRIVIF